MDWGDILKALKLPLKVLLPAIWFFSGVLLFFNDDILNELNLLEWSKKNGFVFGLLFVVSSCFIFVYCLHWMVNYIKRKTLKRRIFYEILDLNEVELSAIASLYKSADYSSTLDYNESIIQSLLRRSL